MHQYHSSSGNTRASFSIRVADGSGQHHWLWLFQACEQVIRTEKQWHVCGHGDITMGVDFWIPKELMSVQIVKTLP
jgi:hypothetical protein